MPANNGASVIEFWWIPCGGDGEYDDVWFGDIYLKYLQRIPPTLKRAKPFPLSFADVCD